MRTKYDISKALIFFSACLLVIILVDGGRCYGATTLRFGVTTLVDHPWIKGIVRLSQEVERTSRGKVKIAPVHYSAAGPSPDLLRYAQAGSIDMALLGSSHLGDTITAMKIFSLPFVFRDKIQANIATTGSLGAELLKEVEKQNLVGLAFVPSEDRVLINTVRPILRPEDFKGLQIFAMPDPIVMETLKALGATPISPIPWRRLYAAMDKGVANATEGPPHAFSKMKIYEVAKYMTPLTINYFPGVIIASEKKWMGMQSDERKLITDSISSIVKTMNAEFEHRSALAISVMKGMGVTVSYPKDISPFRDAVKKVFLAESKKIPRKYRKVAYNAAYVKRRLQVNSFPPGAAVSYRRHGDQDYEGYHNPTNTSILLEYAVWQIKVEKEKYRPAEKYFNPYRTSEWRVDFKLQKIR